MNFEKMPEPRRRSWRSRHRRELRFAAIGLVAATAVAGAWWFWPARTQFSPTTKPRQAKASDVPASADTLAEADRQTAEVAPVLAEVVRFDRLAAAHLSRRELYRARQLVAKAWEKLEAAAARAPLAQGLDGDMRLRLRFLNRRHAELERIQDLAYEAAEPGPGGTASLRVEASGELYRSVMGPGGDGLEVEGEVFCRRLAWVLGRETQLAGQEGGTLHLTVAAVPGGN